jgi:uncharacterized protein YbjT (DUF2867 family)
MAKIVIAGASGFVGQALINKILSESDHEVIAVSRSYTDEQVQNTRLSFRQCDLFSLLDAEKAVKGADFAIYLVHSMLPSAALDQGSFDDYDLILADNFARAAQAEKLKHIIYLSGLTPEDKYLSAHLRSRLEVEQTFFNYQTPITTLRAGLIVGEEGSSYNILINLIKRLPVLICPAWTYSNTQPIELNDVVNCINHCLGKETFFNESYDLGGKTVFTYQKMLAETAKIMGLKRYFISVPFLSPKLSKLWVSTVTGAPSNLVYPLIDSLKHSMVVNEKRAFNYEGRVLRSFEESLKLTMEDNLSNTNFQPAKEYIPSAFQKKFMKRKSVRSIQRVDLPEGKDALWAAREYMNWLPKAMSPLIKVLIKWNKCIFCLFSEKIVLLELELSEERSTNDRPLFYIKGGLLASKMDRGRLEFREVLNKKYLICGIHDFIPRLPWQIYKYTQAVVHLLVMKAFGRHLKKIK